MMTELQEIELEYQEQSLDDYRASLIRNLAITPRLALIESEHLHTQMRNATPSKEPFWNNRINILLEVVQKHYPELLGDIYN